MVTKFFVNKILKKYPAAPFFALVASSTFLIDQFLKFLMRSYQPELNFGVLSLRLSTNTGAAFSILQQQAPWLALFSFLVAAGMIYFYPRFPQEKFPQALFALFLGGVLGNLADRAIYGAVADFIDFSFWPSFNVADSAITVAAMGLIFYYWKK